MSEAWREWLYPLGFLASLAFGGRALIQWLGSEIRGASIVGRPFWYLSLAGNLLLLLHGCIQLQYHVTIVQACNSVIAWRNLNLMRAHPCERKSVIISIVIAIAVVTTFFLLQTGEQSSWFRIPEVPWLSPPTAPLSNLWHCIGFIGIALFSSRFWVQWWAAEYRGYSHLGPPFWWVSLFGAALSTAYFSQTKDLVNLIGPLIGMVPYIRNLMLIRQEAA